MGSRLDDVGKTLGVNEKDIHEIEKAYRRGRLARVAEIVMPAAAAILGLLAGEAAFPVRHEEHVSPYPFAPMFLGASALRSSRVRSWSASIAVSVISFVVALVLIAWVNSAASNTYGESPKYGVYRDRTHDACVD